jgi:hypothetical protein
MPFTAIVVFSFFILSCDLWPEQQTGNFWAVNFVTNKHYRVDAELIVKGIYCNVYVEKGSGVTADTAQKVADDYDTKIYSKMIETFSAKDFTFLNYKFNNIMELADWLADEDGKLTILLLDIKDGSKEGESYVDGYFWAGNFLNVSGSNMRDMIYVDTNPGKPGTEDSNSTLAHEMQHLMNFVSSVLYRSTIKNKQITDIDILDTWIDEGLSSAAEWLYLEEHPAVRWKWYNTNGSAWSLSGDIDKGNNFFVWGNRSSNPNASLDDYATVYLFFQWLRIQASNKTGIYRDIITSYPYSDYRAVTNAASSISPSYSSWDNLLSTWLAANFINASNGVYGYKNDPVLKDIKAPYAPTSPTTIQLYPGEGVYSKASTNPTVSGQGTNIKNAYLYNNQKNNTWSAGDMLTYNNNTNLNGPSESGRVTGVGSSVTMPASGGRSVQSGSSILSGPFRIDAGDLLRSRGSEWNLPLFMEITDE